MGLDCFWKLPRRAAGEGLALPEEGRLCGGLLSGAWRHPVVAEVGPDDPLYDWGFGGEPYNVYGEPVLVGGSFRGKVYDDLLREVGGPSLYQNLSNRKVREAATALERAVEAGTHPRLEEMKLLAVVFRAYAKAGARLVAWS